MDAKGVTGCHRFLEQPGVEACLHGSVSFRKL